MSLTCLYPIHSQKMSIILFRGHVITPSIVGIPIELIVWMLMLHDIATTSIDTTRSRRDHEEVALKLLFCVNLAIDICFFNTIVLLLDDLILFRSEVEL